MSERPAGQRGGRIMLALAWIAALALATYWFGHWEERRANPNRQPQSVHGEGYIEVRLAAGPGGHYLLDGQIDGQTLTFMLDTGASAVAVPQAVAERLALPRQQAVQIRTANGVATGWRTRLGLLQLGDIQLHDVPALITPGMDGEQVLLGMSALRQLEFTQKDGTFVLRQNTQP